MTNSVNTSGNPSNSNSFALIPLHNPAITAAAAASDEQSNAATAASAAQSTAAASESASPELIARASELSQQLGLPPITNLPSENNPGALIKALNKQLNGPDYLERGLKEAADDTKRANSVVPMLKWPNAYRNLLLHDAVLLHFLKMWSDLETSTKAVSLKDRCFFISLLSELQFRPHCKENAEAFKSFQKKISQTLGPQLKELWALNFLGTSIHFYGKRVSDFLPGSTTAASAATSALVMNRQAERMETINITTVHLPILIRSVLSLVDDSINDFRNDGLKNLEDLKKLLRIQGVNLEDLSKRFSSFCMICSARRKDVEEKLNRFVLQLRQGVSPKHIEFLLNDVLSKIELFGTQAKELDKSIENFFPDLKYFIPLEELKRIYDEEFCYKFDVDTPKDFAKDISSGSMKTVLKIADAQLDIEEALKQIEERSKTKKSSKLKTKGLLGEAELLQMTQLLRKEQAKMSNLLQSVKQATLGVVKFTHLAAKQANSDDELRTKYQEELATQVRTKAISQQQLDEKLSDLKMLYRLFCRNRAQLDMLGKGLAALKVFLKGYQSTWCDAPAIEMVDLDVLWPEFQDYNSEDQEVFKTASNQKTNSKDSKIESETFTKEEDASAVDSEKSSSATSVGVASATQVVPKYSLLQNLNPLRSAVRTSFEPTAPLLSKLSMADSALHLGILGSTVSLLKHTQAASTFAKYSSHLMHRVVRSSAIASELAYTSRHLTKHMPREAITHSHLDMEAKLSLANGTSSNSRFANYLRRIDFGSVSSRYEESAVALCNHKKLALPVTLQWCVGSTPFQQSDLFQLASDTFFFAETITGQKDVRYSDMLLRENPATAANAASKSTAQESELAPFLKETLANLSHIILKVKSKVQEYEKSTDSQSVLLTITWKDALSRLMDLSDALTLWVAHPQAEFFASHVDSILTATQLQDELIEEALHITINGKARRGHELASYRSMRGCTLSETEAKAIFDFDIGTGSQYVHRHQYYLKHRGTNSITGKNQPKALAWRLDAMEVSMNSEAYDSGMTPGNGRKIDFAKMQREIIEKVSVMVAITKASVNFKIAPKAATAAS